MNNKYKDLQYLKDKLLYGNEEVPNVIGAEASAGKTTSASIGMVEAYNKNKRSSHLITKERLECIDIVKKCNEIAGFEIAKAFISLEKDEDIDKSLICGVDELNKYPIIISTHARYIRALEYKVSDLVNKNKLRENEKTISYIEYFKSVNNFIIDEQIDLIKNTYFSITLERLESLLNGAKQYDSDNCYFKISSFIQPIIEYMKGYKLTKNKLTRCGTWILLDDKLWYLKSQINQMINSLKSKNENIVGFSNKELESIVDGVELIYKNINEIGMGLSTVILIKQENVTSISTYNHRIKLMLAENNFILDASSPFMSIYDSNMFKKVKTERLIDHSNSNFILNKFNTSTTAYKSDIGNEKIKYILNNLSNYNGEKLVICKDNYSSWFEDFGFENFETAKAKNTYKDYENVFITHTTRMELPYYIFCYDYYNMEIADDIIYVNDNVNGGVQFNNKKIQSIYEEYTADMYYQACKRVQRNTSPKANYVFYGNYIPSIIIVYNQLSKIPKPIVEFMDDKFTVFNRLFEFIQNKWDGSRLYIKNLSIKFNCTNKAISNALDKLEAELVLDQLGITYGKYEKSYFIQSSKLLEERYNFYNKLDMIMLENRKVGLQNKKREVNKMRKLVKWLEANVDKKLKDSEKDKLKELTNCKTIGKINGIIVDIGFVINSRSDRNGRWWEINYLEIE